MSKRVRLALAGGGIGVAVILLMVTSIRAATSYYYTLAQFRALGGAEVGRAVKVNGTVGQDVVWNYAAQLLTFDVVGTGDPGGVPAPLPVVYHGPEPDTFAPGISVVVSGRLTASGTFDAEQVLVKCPSTYVAASSTTR
jgi:cytochrome c-type biogenesis protein CcmE